MTDFEINPDMDDHAVEGVKIINEALRRLTARRVENISVEGPLQASKTAWKVAVYKEAQLHRVVALTSSCASSCNRCDALGSALTARALIETVAMLMDLDQRLKKLLDDDDIDSIDALVMNRLFASRHLSMIEITGITSVNVVTIIDRLAQKHKLGDEMKRYYAELSELCHPNFWGHFGLFGTINREAYETTFPSPERWFPMILTQVLGAAMCSAVAEIVFNNLDKAVPRVAELQRRIRPAGSI